MNLFHQKGAFSERRDYIPNSLVGGIGKVKKLIRGDIERGRIQYQSSDWFAICEQSLTLQPGTLVRIVGVSNTTLLVEPKDNRN